MTLDKITSLADLVFRAKTNKYYKKLAIMTAEWLGYTRQTTYEIALNTLYKVAATQGEAGCQPVVNAVNNLRSDLQEDLEPVAVPIVDESIKKEKDERLLKKKEEAKENVSEWILPPWRMMERERHTTKPKPAAEKHTKFTADSAVNKRRENGVGDIMFMVKRLGNKA